MFILAIALTPLAPNLWITNQSDPAPFAVVGLVVGTLLFIDLVIDLGVPIERRQIDQVFSQPRWAEWQFDDRRVWFSKSGIYDEQDGYVSLDSLKEADYYENAPARPVSGKGEHAATIYLSNIRHGGNRYGSYDTRARMDYAVPKGREAEAQALVERYKKQYRLLWAGHRFSTQQVDDELGGLIRAAETNSRNRRHLPQSVCRRQLLVREVGLDGQLKRRHLALDEIGQERRCAEPSTRRVAEGHARVVGRLDCAVAWSADYRIAGSQQVRLTNWRVVRQQQPVSPHRLSAAPASAKIIHGSPSAQDRFKEAMRCESSVRS